MTRNRALLCMCRTQEHVSLCLSPAKALPPAPKGLNPPAPPSCCPPLSCTVQPHVRNISKRPCHLHPVSPVCYFLCFQMASSSRCYPASLRPWQCRFLALVSLQYQVCWRHFGFSLVCDLLCAIGSKLCAVNWRQSTLTCTSSYPVLFLHVLAGDSSWLYVSLQ